MDVAIVSIHGMWSTPEMLREAVEQIIPPGVKKVVEITLPGHERWDPNDTMLAKASIASYRDYVFKRLEEERKTHRLILVGHSMGGLLALQAAAEGYAEGVVLLSPGAPKGVGNLSLASIPLILSVSLHQLLTFGFWRRPYRPSPSLAQWTLFGGLSPEARNTVLSRMVGESVKALVENLSAPLVALLSFSPRLGHPRAVAFKQVSCPILCVFGGRDRITPPKIGRHLRKLLVHTPHSLFIEIDEASHWLFAEPHWNVERGDSPSLAHRIRDWIAEVLSRK